MGAVTEAALGLAREVSAAIAAECPGDAIQCWAIGKVHGAWCVAMILEPDDAIQALAEFNAMQYRLFELPAAPVTDKGLL